MCALAIKISRSQAYHQNPIFILRRSPFNLSARFLDKNRLLCPHWPDIQSSVHCLQIRNICLWLWPASSCSHFNLGDRNRMWRTKNCSYMGLTIHRFQFLWYKRHFCTKEGHFYHTRLWYRPLLCSRSVSCGVKEPAHCDGSARREPEHSSDQPCHARAHAYTHMQKHLRTDAHN